MTPNQEMKQIIIIDASSSSLGGGLTHLIEFLKESLNGDYFFEIICSDLIADKISTFKNVKIKTHPFLNKTIFHRFFFQLVLIDELINFKAKALLSLTGDYLGKFRPFLGICQNMLLYERNKLEGMGVLLSAKFLILKYRQVYCFNRSNGVIFLSKHAKNVVYPLIKKNSLMIINFGISERFIKSNKLESNIIPSRFLYVSSIHTYKNQLNLVLAFKNLIQSGIDLKLTLVGPILNYDYWRKVKQEIDKVNKESVLIDYVSFIDYNEIHNVYNNSEIFIFPSLCENMPNILLEAMKSNIPILSSNLDPMPEFLKDYAVYFNPIDIKSIQESIYYSLSNYNELKKNASRAFVDMNNYTWKKNYNETINFIEKISNSYER